MRTELRDAQDVVELRINGRWYARLPYRLFTEPGLAPDTQSAICHDCHAALGMLHIEGCDMERCPRCDGQIISCDCEVEEARFSEGP